MRFRGVSARTNQKQTCRGLRFSFPLKFTVSKRCPQREMESEVKSTSCPVGGSDAHRGLHNPLLSQLPSSHAMYLPARYCYRIPVGQCSPLSPLRGPSWFATVVAWNAVTRDRHRRIAENAGIASPDRIPEEKRPRNTRNPSDISF